MPARGTPPGELIFQTILLILASLAIGYWATRKNRRWWPWTLGSLFFTPLITSIVLLIAGTVEKERVEEEQVEKEQ